MGGSSFSPPTDRKAVFLFLAAAILLPVIFFGQSQEKARKETGTAKLRIEVTGGEEDKPVENASIYLRYVEERVFKDKKVEMNLKTNREGVTKAPDVPRGKVLIQVIAPGWKTFGQWYEIAKDEQTIKIRLQKPPRWY